MPAAALTNTMMSHTDDFDDTHGVAVVHPSSTVVPTNLAVGELCLSTGKEFLTSAIAAYEVLLRIGMVAPGKFHDVGFHPTGLCGIFGSAISTSKLRGVNREIAQNALGICGSLSAGILEFLNDGSNVKRLHSGWACYSGILAVIFAEEGITGPREVFEGRYGFLM